MYDNSSLRSIVQNMYLFLKITFYITCIMPVIFFPGQLFYISLKRVNIWY